jgi:hypothetical protein
MRNKENHEATKSSKTSNHCHLPTFGGAEKKWGRMIRPVSLLLLLLGATQRVTTFQAEAQPSAVLVDPSQVSPPPAVMTDQSDYQPGTLAKISPAQR